LQSRYNELAHSDETCWARGQGWNIAGLALAYDATGAERYLRALKATTDYYVDHSPNDLVPYWDFEDPEIPEAPRDTSAATPAAYRLGSLDDASAAAAELRRTGGTVLSPLVDDYLILDATDDRYGMVTHSCYNKPGEYVTAHETIWTDFYVAAAIDAALAGRQRERKDPVPGLAVTPVATGISGLFKNVFPHRTGEPDTCRLVRPYTIPLVLRGERTTVRGHHGYADRVSSHRTAVRSAPLQEQALRHTDRLWCRGTSYQT
jgi:hypothetical protein